MDLDLLGEPVGWRDRESHEKCSAKKKARPLIKGTVNITAVAVMTTQHTLPAELGLTSEEPKAGTTMKGDQE